VILEQTGAALATHPWDGENRMLTAADTATGAQTNTYDGDARQS
jgi:hypothetical protein